MTAEPGDQADAPTPDDELEPGQARASWGPTWGPETADDAAGRDRRRGEWRGWHPPGGPW